MYKSAGCKTTETTSNKQRVKKMKNFTLQIYFQKIVKKNTRGLYLKKKKKRKRNKLFFCRQTPRITFLTKITAA